MERVTNTIKTCINIFFEIAGISNLQNMEKNRWT
jgi:hypothetical protein